MIDAMDETEEGWRDIRVSPLGADGVDQGMWAVVFSWLGIRCFLERGGLEMIGSESWGDGMICKLPLLRRVTDGWQMVEGGRGQGPQSDYSVFRETSRFEFI